LLFSGFYFFLQNPHPFNKIFTQYDTVSIEKENGERFFYRVQKLGGGYDITLRLNIASTINDKDQCLPLMAKGVIESNLIVHKINAIGSLIDD
jgi:hypothetical protein